MIVPLFKIEMNIPAQAFRDGASAMMPTRSEPGCRPRIVFFVGRQPTCTPQNIDRNSYLQLRRSPTSQGGIPVPKFPLKLKE